MQRQGNQQKNGKQRKRQTFFKPDQIELICNQQQPVFHPAVPGVKFPGDAATLCTDHHHSAPLGSAEKLGLGNLQAVPCCRFGVGCFSATC